MHENFIALDKEKRDRIINAAMREFTDKGFKNASTNQIVKNACISKGALFHYFSSKQDLYEFLVSYSVDYFITEALPYVSGLPTDVFERWTEFAALKFNIAAKYPDMSDFMQCAYTENNMESNAVLKKEIDRFSMTFLSKINDGIDLTMFRPEVDVHKALKIIWWVLEGFAKSKKHEGIVVSKAGIDDIFSSMIEEMKGLLAILRKSLYKEEFH